MKNISPNGNTTTLFKVGELVILEDGEYSDKSWSGPFKVLKDFDMLEAAEKCKAEYKPRYDYDEAGPWELREWLCRNGYLEDVDSRRIHLGCYGRIEVER